MSETVSHQAPQHLLVGIEWSFSGETQTDRQRFIRELLAYQEEIAGNRSWDARSVALPFPKVRVKYQLWSSGREIERQVELVSDEGNAFSSAELLYKLHNAVVQDLERSDHHFFEGLTLVTQPILGQPATYILHLGS